MTKAEVTSCIQTITLLKELAYNIHGYMDVIDAENCKKMIELLKEQEKKQITLHKKHVVTWNRNDTFSMRNLYEAICEELLDEGELFIARTDDHEKVDFVFYVTEGR